MAVTMSAKTVSAPRVGAAAARRAARPARTASVVVRAEKRSVADQLPVALTVAVGTAMASPLAAQAAVTPSLKNLLNSVIAGGVVLGAIVVAVSAVSGFDPINTRK